MARCGKTEGSSHHGFLWIRAHAAGTGKSTLMRFALSHEQDQSGPGDNIIISAFFHARGETLEKSVEGMYQSLLLRLLERAPHLQKALDCLQPNQN